jgi:hypothetical protein
VIHRAPRLRKVDAFLHSPASRAIVPPIDARPADPDHPVTAILAELGLAVVLSIVALPLTADAQAPGKVYRVGCRSAGSAVTMTQ